MNLINQLLYQQIYHILLDRCYYKTRQPDGKVRPVSYVSRLLTNTEQQYVQIEKEGLSVMWVSQ